MKLRKKPVGEKRKKKELINQKTRYRGPYTGYILLMMTILKYNSMKLMHVFPIKKEKLGKLLTWR